MTIQRHSRLRMRLYESVEVLADAFGVSHRCSFLSSSTVPRPRGYNRFVRDVTVDVVHGRERSLHTAPPTSKGFS